MPDDEKEEGKVVGTIPVQPEEEPTPEALDTVEESFLGDDEDDQDAEGEDEDGEVDDGTDGDLDGDELDD